MPHEQLQAQRLSSCQTYAAHATLLQWQSTWATLVEMAVDMTTKMPLHHRLGRDAHLSPGSSMHWLFQLYVLADYLR
jgi:hypothetical protein